MATDTYDLTIEQGATFQLLVAWKNPDGSAINLTGYSARMQIRKAYNSLNTLLSLANGAGLTLGGAAGTVMIAVSAAQTAALRSSGGVWDLEVEGAGGEVVRLIEGRVKITPEVTR